MDGSTAWLCAAVRWRPWATRSSPALCFAHREWRRTPSNSPSRGAHRRNLRAHTPAAERAGGCGWAGIRMQQAAARGRGARAHHSRHHLRLRHPGIRGTPPQRAATVVSVSHPRRAMPTLLIAAAVDARPCPRLANSILGHEAVGIVSRSARPGIQPGERVSFAIIDCCHGNQCARCRSGLPQKCTNLVKVRTIACRLSLSCADPLSTPQYGHRQWSAGALDGCYATHILLRPGTHIVRVPSGIPDACLAPANCALATMVCVRRTAAAHAPRSRSVLILGAGLLGLYGAVLFRSAGFDRVFVSDVSPARLDRVKSFGATPVESSALATALADPVDVLVEVCGSAEAFTKAIPFVRVGGLAVLAGMVHGNTSLPLTGEGIIRSCITITGAKEGMLTVARPCGSHAYTL
jgi:threonine dehydrogenase-like Zn-dependent dehydrogenase